MGTMFTKPDATNPDGTDATMVDATKVDATKVDDTKVDDTTVDDNVGDADADTKAVQSGGKPRVTIDIFGSERKNSKGFLINDIKITPQNLNSTFSSKDQVEHFLTNVFDYVKNSNLPEDQQEPIRNFFHSYKETINIKPASEDSKTAGGGKKKRSRNRKPKSRHRKTKKH